MKKKLNLPTSSPAATGDKLKKISTIFGKNMPIAFRIIALNMPTKFMLSQGQVDIKA